MRNTSRILLTIHALALAAGLTAHAEEDLQAEMLQEDRPTGAEVSGIIGLGFESQYVTSGAEAANESLQPTVELGYEGFYAGLWANLPFDDENNTFFDEYDFYAGYAFEPMDKLTTAIGGTYYWYPQNGAAPNRTRELNLAAEYDTFLSPAIEYNYDFDLEQHEIVGLVAYEWDLSSRVPLDNLALEVGGALGYVHSDDTNSDQVAGKPSDGYAYAEASANLIYQFTENAAVSVGPRASTNNNGSAGNMGGHETHLWWGAAVVAEF